MKKKHKKTKPKKTSAKRTAKKKKTDFLLKSIIAVLLISVIGLGAFLANLIYESNKAKTELKKTKLNLKELQHKISKLENELKKTKATKILTYSEIQDYKDALKTHESNQQQPVSKQQQPQKQPPKTYAYKGKKPKLVIIIDDVAFAYQVRAIKSIPFKITPSFFPPNKTHPNTPEYAKLFRDYMVHVPMQAIHWNKPEFDTLRVDSSYNKILSTIENVKKAFPNVKFINNHTGSKFTSDYDSMDRLFKVLRIENIGFVDSRTTPNSKAYAVNRHYNIPLFSRNIFLDNNENISYIHNQLRKAVNIAKKRGYAIAIGHPHKVTFQALRSARGILKGVDVITINQLYKDQNAKN